MEQIIAAYIIACSNLISNNMAVTAKVVNSEKRACILRVVNCSRKAYREEPYGSSKIFDCSMEVYIRSEEL